MTICTINTYVLCIQNHVYNRVNLVTTCNIGFHPHIHTLPNIETNIVALLWNTRSTVHRRNVYTMWKMYASREYYTRTIRQAKATRNRNSIVLTMCQSISHIEDTYTRNIIKIRFQRYEDRT